VIVQKYGGDSISTIAGIRRVSARIARLARTGRQLVVVVSAMGRTTDDLVGKAYRITPEPSPRELAMLLANGETITAPLVAMALQRAGVPAVSLSAAQAGVRTNADYSTARILAVRPERVRAELAAGRVAVVAGFQGITDDLEVTTLGRGGADTTAVALAAALGAEVCEIHTPAEGILTADPRLVPEARLIRHVSYEETLQLAGMGLRIVQPRAVEIAEAYGVPVHVRSSSRSRPGTMIVREVPDAELRPVCAIAHDAQVGQVRLHGLPNRPGIAAALFEPLGEQGVSVDVINQVGSSDAAFSFVVREADLRRAVAAITPVADRFGAAVSQAGGRAKVSLVGGGMRTKAGVAARTFRALAAIGVGVEMVATSEIRITCVLRRADHERAVRALHAAFGLDREDPGAD
jgi:aspartate kinase